MSGTLFIIATPIGNLRDITLRALDTLNLVDAIACEDTRHSLKLFQAHGIAKPLISLHDHNEAARAETLCEKILSGKNIALVSDAGTPLISDPGFRLIRRALELGIPVDALPGPCAAINALALSGLATDSFYFVGFLPVKSAARLRKFEALAAVPATLIFYESPYRVEKFFQESYQVLGNRSVTVAREMTKKFQEVLRTELEDLQGGTKLRSLKGEFVILVAGAGKTKD